MDPRVAPPKPHQGVRQAHRQSQRRFQQRKSGPDSPARYNPPPDLRYPPPLIESIPQTSSYSQQSRGFYEIHGIGDTRDAIAQSKQYAPTHTYSTRSAPTVDDAQLLSVTLDYVPDRGPLLWTRWFLILICMAQLVSAFAVVGCLAMDFSEDTKLEVGVTVGLITFGNVFGKFPI